jgi:hypothetical protein
VGQEIVVLLEYITKSGESMLINNNLGISSKPTSSQ